MMYIKVADQIRFVILEEVITFQVLMDIKTVAFVGALLNAMIFRQG